MFTVKITGTLFVAFVLMAALFYFGGGFVRQIGETTGMQTLKDVGQGGINIGLLIVIIIVVIIVIGIIIYYAQENR